MMESAFTVVIIPCNVAAVVSAEPSVTARAATVTPALVTESVLPPHMIVIPASVIEIELAPTVIFMDVVAVIVIVVFADRAMVVSADIDSDVPAV